MPKVSKDSAAQVEEQEPIVDRYEEINGYTVNFVSFHQRLDTTPLFRGLPGSSCPCHHWGYVLEGKLTFRFADHEEIFEAGDAFYVPPGHVPIVEAGSELVQFTPSESLRTVTAAIIQNLRGMGG